MPVIFWMIWTITMCKSEQTATMTRADLQLIAKFRAAHDKRKRATSCKLLKPQIAIDCNFPDGLLDLIRDQPPMNKRDIEGYIVLA